MFMRGGGQSNGGNESGQTWRNPEQRAAVAGRP